jgi:hypothetical protein
MIALNLDAKSPDQYASSRQQRQKRLRAENPPNFWAVLDEAALRRQVGGPKVMRDQIEHLAQCAAERQVVLQILPFEAGAHAGMQGNFAMLQFEEDVPDLVYVEGGAGAWYLSRDTELKVYRQMFDFLRATAESPDDSLDRLQAMLAAWPD